MAELSRWFAEVFQDLGSDGPLEVTYYQSSQELVEAVRGAEIKFSEHTPGGGYEKTFFDHIFEPKRSGPEESKDHPISTMPKPKIAARKGVDQERKKEKDTKIQRIEDFLLKILPIAQEIIEVLRDRIKKKNIPAQENGSVTSGSRVPNEGIITEESGDPFGVGTNSHYQYALVHGTPTAFNPSGIWVVEDAYNDVDD